jgi:eukaryotic-like serine/threonine-protein kinase
LIDSDGELFVKVLDFGIAKRTQDAGLGMTSTGTMVGTPFYMSPEQVMSAKGVDFRADLWSVAVVAYNALTGTLPFQAETLGALCVAINMASFTPVSSVRPGLPPALDTWFARALSRDPAGRFGSAKELAEALARAAGGQPAPQAESAFTQSALHVPAAPTPVLAASTPHPGTLHGMTSAGTRPGTSRTLFALAGVVAALVVAAGILVTIVITRVSAKPDLSGEPAASGEAAGTQAETDEPEPAAEPTAESTAETEPEQPEPPASASAAAAAGDPRRATRSTTTVRPTTKTTTKTGSGKQDKYGF